MKLSHSKLAGLLSCPMSYHLRYDEGIEPIVEKTALQIGSAVHWGIEHNTSNLDEFFKDNGSFTQSVGFSYEQFLAEVMVEAYLKKKEQLFKEILKDDETGEQLELIREEHEIFVTGILPSYKFADTHKFIGIIDLRLLTNKGYIIIDYKTSTFEPHWDDYLEQIYRYIFMSTTSEPDIPVLKCGIINIRKIGLRQKKNEDDVQFKARIKREYDTDDDNLVVLHMYPSSDIDKKLLNNYVDNLSRMADTAQMIILNGAWYINYSAANGQYGKSPYWNIFYQTENCHEGYTISDYFYDVEKDEIVNRRPCRPIDMQVIFTDKCINHYSKYKDLRLEYIHQNPDCTTDDFINYLQIAKYITDDELNQIYEIIFELEQS